MTERKDFRAVNSQYDQDWINGINESEYEVLFGFLKDNNISSILDVGGGNGKLVQMLIKRGYNAFLFDIADNMIAQARRNGVPEEKSIVGDIFTHNFERTFDCVIFKSSRHEIPIRKSVSLNSIVYNLLNDGGFLIDLDAHVPTKETASWLKKWVNIKDTIAELDDLVENRNIYTETFITDSLKQTGFKSIKILHRFFYTISVSKMSEVYWGNDTEKTKKFFDETQKLVKIITDDIIAKEAVPMDIELKVPAVIIVGQK